MKRFLFILTMSFIICATLAPISEAKLSFNRTNNISELKELKTAQKEIRASFALQSKYSNAQDWEKLKDFYADKYRNSDAFNKSTTFSIIKENYEIYPDLRINIKVNTIDVNGNFASVDVYETAKANNIERDDIELKGELRAYAHTIYYMEKIDGKWLITAEVAIEENNAVLFGETRHLDIKLTAPMNIPAKESYTSTLEIGNLPRNALLMGSIVQSPATYPLQEDDSDSLRVLEDTKLERIFKGNAKNVNEYNIASIGITRGQPIPNGGVKLYLSGLGFLMTRVNVIPENTLYTKVQETEVEDD